MTLPFDADYEAALRRLDQQRANYQFGYNQNKQRLGEDYSSNVNQLNVNRDTIYKRLSENMADRGLSYSGINVDEMGRIGKDYQTQVEGLNTSNARSLADLEAGYSNEESGYQSNLADLNTARTRAAESYNAQQAQKQAQAEARQRMLDTINARLNPPPSTVGSGVLKPEIGPPAVNSWQQVPGNNYTGRASEAIWKRLGGAGDFSGTVGQGARMQDINLNIAGALQKLMAGGQLTPDENYWVNLARQTIGWQ